MIWVDFKKWDENWEEVGRLSGGGQGQGIKVCRKGTGEIAFLKYIKNKNDMERRARFSREAQAYYDLSVPTVPQLIESNAHNYKDCSTTPYIVTEYIEGETLREWREGQKELDLEIAIAMTRSLLKTIESCHAQQHIHRDIKPDNIIVPKNSPTNLILVDFGLDINLLKNTSFVTEDGQEIGNRFLRLPELAPDSLLKQDSRSDISFAGGILFYLLTGNPPSQLSDAEGKLPHQRTKFQEILKNISKNKYIKIFLFFDKVFAPQISNRFLNSESAINGLDEIMKDDAQIVQDLDEILKIANSESETRKRHLVSKVEEALKNVEKVIRSIENKIDRTVYSQQINQNIGFESGFKCLIWQRKISNERIFETTFYATIVGDEIVINIDESSVYRTPISTPYYEEQFIQSIEKYLYKQINIALNHPDKLPPNHRIFQGLKPTLNIDEALERSRLEQRYIFAFVYDPSQKEKGQIEHQLGYFLQNKKTRDLLKATFVVTLLTTEQLAEKSDVLQGKSMESSRWVIFDTGFNILEEAVIYANPSEGESIVQRLTERFQLQ